MPAPKLKVFISYSRRDLTTADELVSQLEAEDIEVLIDRRDLPYGEEWQKELAEFIRMSDTVVWLVSPHSIGSKWVNWELGAVGRLGKRLVPVVISKIDPSSLPESLGKIHMLPADHPFDAGRHLGLLVRTLNTDMTWLKEATRLGDRARQWLSKNRDNGLLLRGRALIDAELWARSKPQAAPIIDNEIVDLILNSRKAAVTRQRQFVVGALTIAAVGVGLAVLSWHQRNVALINQSTYLAKLSQDQTAAGDVATGLSLAISALPQWRFGIDRPFVPEAARSLYDAIFALREARLFVGHDADVNTVQFSSDNRLVLTSSDDGTAKIWSAETGTLLQTLGPHGGKVLGSRFSPDDRLVATYMEDNDIRVWDSKEGRLRHTLSGHTGRVTSVEFDAQTGWLISASRDGTARIWHLGARVESMILRGHKSAVNLATISPDGKQAVTSSDDGSAIVWSIATALPEIRLLGHSGAVLRAIFDPSGSKVATFSEDQTVRVWDPTATQPLLATLDAHGGPIASIAFCPHEPCLMAGGRDGISRLWNFQTGKLIEMKGHTQPIMKVVMDPRGGLAATAARDGLVQLWEVKTEDKLQELQKLQTLGGHGGDIFDVAFSHDGGSLATASRDHTARTWKVRAPTTIEARNGLKTTFRSMDISRDGAVVALGTGDGFVRLLEGGSLRQLKETRAGVVEVTLVAFNRAGDRLLTGAADGSVEVYAVPSLTPIFRGTTDDSEIGGGGFDEDDTNFSVITVTGTKVMFDGRELKLSAGFFTATGSNVLAATFSSALDRIVIGDLHGTVRVVNAGTGRLLANFKGGNGAILYAIFSNIGDTVVSASEDGTARVWDAATGNTMVLAGHKAPVTYVAITDDRKLIATASTDRTVRLWRRGESAPVAVYGGHIANVNLVRFVPGRNEVVSASDDGEVHRWAFKDDYSSMLQTAKAAVPRCLSQQQLDRFGLALAPQSWCKPADFAAPFVRRPEVPANEMPASRT